MVAGRRPPATIGDVPVLDRSVLWRAALAQVLGVAALAVALALALPHSFFEDRGWAVGPLAWLACAAVTARVVRLPVAPTLIGAALAGVPSGLATLAGLHWLGALLAVGVLAAWCAALAAHRRAAAADS